MTGPWVHLAAAPAQDAAGRYAVRYEVRDRSRGALTVVVVAGARVITPPQVALGAADMLRAFRAGPGTP